VGNAVAKGPFVLTLATERAKISGWPAPARKSGK
jgi:hypothetical protein